MLKTMAQLNRTETLTQVSEIVYDFLKYQLQRRGFEWTACPPLPPPKKVCLTLRTLGDEFLTTYSEHFAQMCDNLNITPSIAQQAYSGVMNELFSEGITWSRIVGAFAFTSELAVLCMEKQWTEVVDSLAHWLSSYISTHLSQWIQDNSGWEGLIQFSDERGSDKKLDSPWPAFKSVVCGVAVTALGALTLGAILTSKS